MCDSYVRGGQGWTSVCCCSLAPTGPRAECLLCQFINVPVCYNLLCHLSSSCNVHWGSQRGCKSAGCNTTRDPEEQPLPSFTFKNVVSLYRSFSLTKSLTHSLTHSLSAHHFILQILLLIGLYRERYSTGTAVEGLLPSCRVLIKGTLVDNPFV